MPVFTMLLWLFLALMAGLSLTRQKKSLPLMFQALGGLGYFLLAVVSWMVLGFLTWIKAWDGVLNPTATILTFLQVIALLLFAAGFCWEKLLQWRHTPANATAVPVP